MDSRIPSRATRPAVARRERIRRRLRRSSLTAPIIHAVGGVAIALVALAVDALAGEEALPGWLHIGQTMARATLIALGSSFLFVVSVVFWVRIWAVQVSAQPVLSRVLTQFLTDRVQRHAMGFIIGAMAYVLTVLRALPQDGAGMDSVPHVAVTLAYVLAVAVAVIIVFAIDNAARWGQVSRLIRQIADQTVATIRARHPPLGEADTDGVPEADLRPADGQPPPVVVEARTSGWVGFTDEDLLLDALPPGSTIQLAVRVGSFTFEGSPLARVWTDRPDEVAETQIRAAVAIAVDPSFEEDVAYGVGELVDIATRSMTSSSRDSTTAREAVLHLGVVLRELLLRDLPVVDRADDENRRLLRGQDLRLSDYLEAAFGRLRTLVGDSPTLADAMLGVIDMLVQQLDGVARPRRQELLREQARALLREAHERATVSDGQDRLGQRARTRDLLPDDATTTASESG